MAKPKNKILSKYSNSRLIKMYGESSLNQSECARRLGVATSSFIHWCSRDTELTEKILNVNWYTLNNAELAAEYASQYISQYTTEDESEDVVVLEGEVIEEYKPASRHYKQIMSDDDIEFLKNNIANGLPIDDVANLLFMDIDTLKSIAKTNTKVRKAYLWAKSEKKRIIADTAFQHMRGGNVAMCIFLAKVQLHWRETSNLEISGKDGAPIETVSLDSVKSTQEALTTYEDFRKGLISLDDKK